MSTTESVEEIFNEIGFGRWQGLALLAVLLSQISNPVQQLGSTLLSAPVPFRCSIPNYAKGLNHTTNITGFEQYVLFSEEGTVEYPSQCLPQINLMDHGDLLQIDVFKTSFNARVTGLPSCPVVEYDTSTFQSTVITEWNLICENSSIRPLFQMSFALGTIVGSLFCGHLSDWLGRKRAVQLGAALMTVSTVLTGLVPWYSIIICMRIMCGTSAAIFFLPAYTLLSEVSPTNRRTLISMTPGFTYSGAIAAFAGFAYLLPQWRMLFLLCNSPLLILVLTTFLIDESPRWLLQKGRTAEAAGILRRAAAQNKVTLSSSSSSLLEKFSHMSKDIALGKFAGFEEEKSSDKDDPANQGTLSMLRISFSSPGMRVIMIVLPIVWILLRSLYVGIAINANNFTSSNPFEYVAITGAMGIVSTIIFLPLSVKVARRFFLLGTLSTGGIIMLLEMFVPSDYWWAKWVMVMASFCLICGSFQVSYIYTAELFPTVMRTRGFSYTSFIGTVGEMMIPLVTDIVVQYKSWAPNVTFSLAGLGASALLPFLPETMDRAMPETMQDVEDRFWYNYKGLGKDGKVEKGVVKPNDFSEGKESCQM